MSMPDLENHLHELEKSSTNDPIPLTPFPAMVSASELLNRKVENIPCLIEPMFPRVGLACVAGGSDTGKSAFLRQLCLSVVTGEEYFVGFPVKPIHKRAIYVSTEDDERAISYLLNKQNKGKNLSAESYDGLHYIFDTLNLLEQLEYYLQRDKCDVIVLDAFGDLFGKASMNDANIVRSFLQPYKQLADKHECLIIFLHHTGKRREEGEPSKHNLIGSQGLEAKMRLVIELRADFFETDKRHLCIVKGNYMPANFKSQSFVLRFDENMLFYNTGQTTSFESLAKVQGINSERVDKYTQARQLKDQGLTLEQIAEQLGYSNKGAVSKLLNTSQVAKVSREVSTGNQQETDETEGFQVSFP